MYYISLYYIICIYYLLKKKKKKKKKSMICVFAQLIQSQMETVISFLAQLNIDGKSGLEIILRAWCEHYDSFQGVYKTKLW